ncbi:MAG: FtsX-like permease family protein, partial [Betaproteobacteria bacterium]|nr:FtsX-like permease family protein [Betaproteobacteria bacterium]
MNLLATLRVALNALRVNLLRSVLTMLGIIIGVAAVITMLAVGSGAEARIKEQIKSLGSNLMIVTAGARTANGARIGTGITPDLTEDDAAAIAREVPEVEAVAPTYRGSAQVVFGNANWATQVFGITPDYFTVRNWTLESGRMFEPAEMSGAGKVAMIGQTVARELFGDADPMDQTIRIKNVPVTIVGVLGRKGQNMTGNDQDDVIMVPLSTARNRIVGVEAGKPRQVGMIQIKVFDGESMSETEDKIRALLRQRLRTAEGQPDPITVRNLTEMLAAQEESSKVMSMLLAAVASVSLLVGGIGIMNIMLVSVTERTREIGLRMAVGARAADILTQFLVEAVTLSLVGGLIGIALGVGGSWMIAEFAGWQTQLSTASIALAVSFSAAIGIFFG